MQRRLGLDLEVPDEFGHFLAGFSAGEAYFDARIYRDSGDGYKRLPIKYGITLRADDRPALEYIQGVLGVGTIYHREKVPNPIVEYRVFRIGDLYHIIVPLFEKYPIPPCFKKAKDFEIWKRIVAIRYHQIGFGHQVAKARSPHPQSYWDKIEPLVEHLKKQREYIDPT